MAITKTKFINYIRCPRYVSLEDISVNSLESNVTFEEYREEEQMAKMKELLSSMYDEENNDLLAVKDEQLEVMLPYYKEVEHLACINASKYFKGKFKFSYDTQDQESFDFKVNGIRYLCYVDIYNELDDSFNIIEVKATTSKKFLSIGKKKDGILQSIFKKGNDGIYYLLEDLDNVENYMSLKNYNKYKEKLYDKYDKAGHYIYDLAIQRYFIEQDLIQNNQKEKIDKIKYYLAVLNCEYEFDGVYENNQPVYNTDKKGNDIVCFFDMTSLTKNYMDIIDSDRKCIESYIHNLNGEVFPIGTYCEHNCATKCKYIPICWKHIPNKNSIFKYIDNHHGFVDLNGNRYERFELINEGITHMLDLPKEYLNREKNRIQRQVLETKTPYIDKEKIKSGIEQITYPLYHLDFETFPCPLPRFRGEVPYTQSVFQFSLHIEKYPGCCDKEKDHYGFLATNLKDNREELIIELLNHIDVNSGGTVLVYNESFEKTRLKELSNIFPKYKEDLLKLRDMVFDLMNITKTKTSFYEQLGFDSERASLFNYYHEDMNGSFSIKKILPLFSNLTYEGMDISNGVEALVTYAKFEKMDKFEYEYKYKRLVEYCKQDTWAMVEILNGLREVVK